MLVTREPAEDWANAHRWATRMSNVDLLDRLVGLRCVGATAQIETGGDLLVHFGKWVTDVTGSKRLPPTQRGEYVLMIASTPWRLDGKDEPLGDWETVTDEASPYFGGHRLLANRTLERAEVEPPAWDLQLTFSESIRLSVFCDLKPRRPENWFVLGPEGQELVAGPGYRLAAGASRTRR